MKSILQQHIYGAYKFLRNVSDDEETEQEEEEMESNHAISLIEEDDITKRVICRHSGISSTQTQE